jgi:hypothetical protein
LADEVAVMDALYKRLMEKRESFLRELSEGFIRLLDEVYLEERAEKYGGSVERLLREDPTIHESEERRGNLVLSQVGEGGFLGKWWAPMLDFGGFGALATVVNTATLRELRGTPIKDLPLTLTFRMWADNPFKGLFQDVFCKIRFERRPDGAIWVDFDCDEPGSYSPEDGLEWLASYYFQTDRWLSKAERRQYAPQGALKLYDKIKDKPVIGLMNSDIF